YLLVYAALASLMGLLFFRLPTAYVPEEDQGFLMVITQTPVGSVVSRTVNAMHKVEDYFMTHEPDLVSGVFLVSGFSPGGVGQNAGFGYVVMKDWDERRKSGQDAPSLQRRGMRALAAISDAQAFVFAPPAISELGQSAGFDFYLKDEEGRGHESL